MDVTVDCLNLNGSSFYKQLKKNESISEKLYPKNIFEYGDDVLYAWDHLEAGLLVCYTKCISNDGSDELQEKNGGSPLDKKCSYILKYDKVQRLRPSLPIETEVLQLSLNPQKTRIAVSSREDVYVIDLPARSGPDGFFKFGLPDVLCGCRKLCVQRCLTVIQQVHWHPSPEFDYYLTILTSNNVIQLCDVRSPEFVDQWLLDIGCQNRLPSLESMGEAAVDFQFMPLSSYETHTFFKNSILFSNEAMEWPALVLRGNGDVVIIDLSIKKEGRKYGLVTEPLLMSPSADDNYGVDCTGILILDGLIPFVVIASKTGVLYHCILLTHPSSEFSLYNGKNDESSFSIRSGKHESSTVHVLHVIESIELDFGVNLMSQDEDMIDDEMVSSLIKLKLDGVGHNRYFALHGAGVHTINLPILHELKIFFSKTYDSGVANSLPLQALLDFRKSRSVVEYSVCSQLSGEKPCPVLGAVCIECPTPILVILFPNKIISLVMITWYLSPKSVEGGSSNGILTSDGVDILKEESVPSIKLTVQQILRPDNKNTPIFKMSDPANPTAQLSLELLARATSYFREMIFPRHEQAAQVIRSKVHMLRNMKERQQDDFKQLLSTRIELQKNAESLAEKFDSIYDKQVELSKRAENILINLKSKEEGLTMSEILMVRKLHGFEKKMSSLQEEIDRLRIKERTQSDVLEWANRVRIKEYKLNETHLDVIKRTCAEMSSELGNLVDEIKVVEADLNFDINQLQGSQGLNKS